jgi:hypothetical protein
MCNNFSGIVKDIQNMSPTFKNGALEHNTSDIERQPNTLPIDLSTFVQKELFPLIVFENLFDSGLNDSCLMIAAYFLNFDLKS